MSNELEFAVVFWVDRGKPAIFDGSEEEVYNWMSTQNNKGMWEVWNREARTYESGDYFLERLAEKYKPKPPLTEEDVLRLIDKRVGEVLETVAKEAEDRSIGLAAYETSDLMRPAFSAVCQLLEYVTNRLQSKGDSEE